MNICVSCDHEMSDDARFCSQCGLPVAATISEQELLENSENQDWLLAPTNVARTPQRSGVVGRVLAGILALTIGATALLLFRSPTEEAEGIADGLITPTTRASTTTAPTESSTVEPESTESAVVAGEPLTAVTELDGLAGHYIVAASTRSFQRIDTDTGEVETFDVAGQVIGHFEGDLIILDDDGDLLQTSLAAPDEPTLRLDLPDVDGDSVAVTTSGDGQIYIAITSWDGDGPSQWRLIHADLARGLAGEVKEVSTWSFYGLVNAAGGGLFEVTSDGFRHLIDGTPTVVGSRFVVVEQCQDPTDCRRFWYDRQARVEINRTLPPSDLAAFLAIAIDAKATVLLSLGGPGASYFNTSSGQFLSDDFQTRFSESERFIVLDSVSPSGRHLVSISATGTNLLLYDLDTDVITEVPLETTWTPTKTLIVAKEP